MTSTPVPVPDHTRLVRVTHWVNLVAFVVLVISGYAILIAHPRLYWGDAGNAEMPAAFELPVAENLFHSGWGRSLHFLAGWMAVINGAIYLVSGWLRSHFSKRLGLSAGARVADPSYGALQKLVYLSVIFLLGPALILTGLTMSPAVTSAAPGLVSLFAGRQSARTLHFFAGLGLVLFLVVHLVQVIRAGFRRQLRAMILGADRR